jgi:hypothetical protein
MSSSCVSESVAASETHTYGLCGPRPRKTKSGRAYKRTKEGTGERSVGKSKGPRHGARHAHGASPAMWIGALWPLPFHCRPTGYYSQISVSS